MNKKLLIFASLMSIVPNCYSNSNNIHIEGRLDDNCKSTLMLNDLKKEVKRIQAHGLTLYIHPKKTPKTYTGCKNVWLENGHKLVTQHYSNGILTWARGQEPKEVRPYFCLYKNNKLINNMSFNLKRCPSNAKEFE